MFFLLETGDRLLLESGDALLLQATAVVADGNLLLESGDALLKEDGDNVLLEGATTTPNPPPTQPVLLLESGDFLLLEDGWRLLLESDATPAPVVFSGGGAFSFQGRKPVDEEEDEELTLILSLISGWRHGGRN